MNNKDGYFQFILAIDCETTGLTFNTADCSINDQAISWGLVVAKTNDLKPIDELYLEIKWNEQSKAKRREDPSFGRKAETIHGLTYEYLEENGIDEITAAHKINQLLTKYWGPNNIVRTLGHNVHMFDLPFLRGTLVRGGVERNFGNRHYDTNSAGFIALMTWTSNELFEMMGFDARNTHKAIDDAKMALESARRLRLLFQTHCLNENSE